jgi:aminomethyltransferase
LLHIQKEPPRSVRVGLEMSPGKRAARQGCTILADGRPVGQVTSGTYSPSLGWPIAMGYMTPEFSRPGAELQVDIRGRVESARVVELPFYYRNKKGSAM